MKRSLLTVFFTVTMYCGFSQIWGELDSRTEYRDNAGLQGNAGAKSGFFQTSNPVNYPLGASGWWHLLDIRQSEPIYNYAMQLAGSFYDQNLYFRKTNNNPTQPWSKVLLQNPEGNTTINNNFIFGYANDPKNIYVPLGSSTGGYNIDFNTWRDVDPNQIGARIRGERINNYGDNNALVQGMDLVFYTSLGQSQESLAERLRITNSGNVGVGTTTPQTKLDVDGTGSFKTCLYLKHNGVSSTELLIYKDQNHYYDIGGNSHSFFIYNSSTNNHLLYASSNDNIGIGTTTPTEKFSVNGNIRSRKVIVTQTGWPDYVFEPSYQLPSLDSVHNFIKENKHLPGMASAAVVEKEGLDLGEMVKQQQQKIEELMLYMIEQDKNMKKMEKENEKKYEKLEIENKELKNRIKTLEIQKQ